MVCLSSRLVQSVAHVNHVPLNVKPCRFVPMPSVAIDTQSDWERVDRRLGASGCSSIDVNRSPTASDGARVRGLKLTYLDGVPADDGGFEVCTRGLSAGPVTWLTSTVGQVQLDSRH